MLPRLVLKSWAQAILLPPLQVAGMTGVQHHIPHIVVLFFIVFIYLFCVERQPSVGRWVVSVLLWGGAGHSFCPWEACRILSLSEFRQTQSPPPTLPAGQGAIQREEVTQRWPRRG